MRDASTSHDCFAVATRSLCRRRIYDRTTLRASGRAEGAFGHGTPPASTSQNATCAVLSETRLIGKVVMFVIGIFLVLVGAFFAPPLLGDWLFVTRTKELAGSDAIDCGRVDPTQDPSPGVACAKRAMNEKRPFRIVIDRRRIDSKVADSLISDANGTSYLLTYDSASCGNFLCAPSRGEEKCVSASIDVSSSIFVTRKLVAKISCQGK